MKPTPAQDEAFMQVVRHNGISNAAKAGHGDLSSWLGEELARRFKRRADNMLTSDFLTPPQIALVRDRLGNETSATAIARTTAL